MPRIPNRIRYSFFQWRLLFRTQLEHLSLSVSSLDYLLQAHATLCPIDSTRHTISRTKRIKKRILSRANHSKTVVSSCVEVLAGSRGSKDTTYYLKIRWEQSPRRGCNQDSRGGAKIKKRATHTSNKNRQLSWYSNTRIIGHSFGCLPLRSVGYLQLLQRKMHP